MKTKVFLIALAVLGTSLAYSQNVDQDSSVDCQKKVMKKIQRKMNMVNFDDYLKEDQKARVLVTCIVNDDKEIEVLKVKGQIEGLNNAIIDYMTKHPVKCSTEPSAESFDFYVTFKLVQS